MRKLPVRIFLAVLSVLPVVAIILSAVPVYSDDGLDVKFELIRESPVSVEFEVTVTGTKDAELPVKFNIEPLNEGDIAIDPKLITITELVKENYVEQNPIYKEVTESYTSVFGVYKDKELDENWTLMPEEAAKIFQDLGKDGKAILKEHYYRVFDDKTLTWSWPESIIDYYEQIPKVKTNILPFAQRTSLNKTAVSALSLTASDDKGYGRGVRTFRVAINTPLGKNRIGWGSRGLLVWEVNGQKYFDKTNSSWWDSDWLYREKITLDNSGQAENLIDFPVGVFLDVGNFDFSHAQVALQDIRFVDADDTTDLDYEIRTIVANTSAEIWAEVPQVDASSNTDFIWMYYGNAGVGDGQDVAGTWNANYVFVYHMNDATTSTITGSTALNAAGVKVAANQPVEAAGGIGKTQNFDGTDDYISVADSASLSGLGTLTFESYMNQDVQGGYEGVLSKSALSNIEWYFMIDASGMIYIQLFAANPVNYLEALGTIDVSDTNYHYTAATWDGVNAAGHIALYADAATETPAGTKGGTGYAPSDRASPVEIGRRGYSNTWCFDGKISETRISNIARSAAWIAATNMTFADTYCSYGAEVVGEIPTVTTQAASLVAENSTTLNGNITDVGTFDCDVRGFDYDTNSGAPYASSWTEAGAFTAGAYSHSQAGLSEGTEYFYRAKATNAYGTGYGAEQKFLTLPDPPTAFTITRLDLALQLDWTAGAGADTTYIRGKIGGYPANIADGNLVYSGAAITYTHTPLVYGDVWYYRMWSYVTIDGLSQYSATYAQDFETVTGTPQPPTNFVLTQTGINEITATWVAGFATTSTMIRYGTVSYPGSPTAGYLFYSGALLTATITGVNLETNTYFFSAYGHNPTGYSVTANKKSIGGSSMALMGFIGLAVISTGLAYVLKNGVLKWIGAGGWVILGWYAFTLSTAGWDLYYSFGFLSVFVAIAVAFEYTYGEYQERKQTKVNVNIDMENYRKEYMGQREVLDSMRTTSGVSRRRSPVAGTNDEERILKKSQNLFTQKLEEKYGKPKKRR